MIQRKQTLFLLLLVCTGIAFLFTPDSYVTSNGNTTEVTLLPPDAATGLKSTIWHILAIVLNFTIITLAFITVFLYKKRTLQVKLCYILMLLTLVITVITSYAPLIIISHEDLVIKNSGFAPLIGVIGMMASYLAALFVKKDIELLRNADRIR